MDIKLIIAEIGTVSEKKNVTLKCTFKKGLAKQTLYLLVDEEDAKALKVGDNIIDQVPSNFAVRESTFLGGEDGTTEITTKWIEPR